MKMLIATEIGGSKYRWSRFTLRPIGYNFLIDVLWLTDILSQNFLIKFLFGQKISLQKRAHLDTNLETKFKIRISFYLETKIRNEIYFVSNRN